ncbi:MAG TPA: hypothetical protein VGC21_21640 [Telluria sp.]
MNTCLALTRISTIVCLFALSACASAPPPTVQAAPKLSELLAQATQAAAAGQTEQAISSWKKAALAFPAEKTPWASIAQSRYEAGQYGEAITAAQEVLVRDPNDKPANGIIAISGLRLSVRALGDLGRQSSLTGALRTESQQLAKQLRERLANTAAESRAVSVPTRTGARAPSERVKTADSDDESRTKLYKWLTEKPEPRVDPN